MMKDAVKLTKLICDFLNGLSEEEISALLENEARLKVEFSARKTCVFCDCSLGEVERTEAIYETEVNGAIHRTADKAIKLPDSFFQELDSLDSREKAQELFKQSAFCKAQLVEIARHYSIPVTTKDRNAQIVDRIIESVVGSKLKHETLLTANLHRRSK